jgi:glycosyltransferase involved in cell wall biosynthesis
MTERPLRPLRVAVCASQVPFVRGGAEIHVEGLTRELEARGHETALVNVPSDWTTRRQILENCLAWRLLDLEAAAGVPVDLVIATRFPSYVIRHRHKVVWVIHQLRQVYDMLGTPYSDFQPEDPRDRRVIAAVKAIDRRALGEARARFTNAANTARRMARYNGLDATPLYHPPQHDGRYRCEGYGDFVLGVGRLDPAKRFDLFVRGLAATRSPLRGVIAGVGPERGRLEALARRLGVADRLELAGWVDDDRLLDLYARCRAVYYAPYDEDYGYVTLEAFKSAKPVVTCEDSGGVLEFVQDGVNGWVASASRPRTLGRAFDLLWEDEERARAFGRRGGERVAGISWDHVVDRLTATLRGAAPVPKSASEPASESASEEAGGRGG